MLVLRRGVSKLSKFPPPCLTQRHAHEEPREALELAASVRIGACVIIEEQAAVRAHGRNTSATGLALPKMAVI